MPQKIKNENRWKCVVVWVCLKCNYANRTNTKEIIGVNTHQRECLSCKGRKRLRPEAVSVFDNERDAMDYQIRINDLKVIQVANLRGNY